MNPHLDKSDAHLPDRVQNGRLLTSLTGQI